MDGWHFPRPSLFEGDAKNWPTCNEMDQRSRRFEAVGIGIEAGEKCIPIQFFCEKEELINRYMLSFYCVAWGEMISEPFDCHLVCMINFKHQNITCDLGEMYSNRVPVTNLLEGK